MNLGQACRPCGGSCSLIPGRGCLGDLHGDEIVVSPPSPIVEPLAAAEQLSNALLSYNHHDWEQAQPADHLCDATRRYIKPGYPNPPPLFLCAHLPSHTRPATADIADLAEKATYCREMITPPYSSKSLSPPPRRLMAKTAAGSYTLLMTQSALMCRS